MAVVVNGPDAGRTWRRCSVPNSRPRPHGSTRMSENRMAASKPKRRMGCRVTSVPRPRPRLPGRAVAFRSHGWTCSSHTETGPLTACRAIGSASQKASSSQGGQCSQQRNPRNKRTPAGEPWVLKPPRVDAISGGTGDAFGLWSSIPMMPGSVRPASSERALTPDSRVCRNAAPAGSRR